MIILIPEIQRLPVCIPRGDTDHALRYRDLLPIDSVFVREFGFLMPRGGSIHAHDQPMLHVVGGARLWRQDDMRVAVTQVPDVSRNVPTLSGSRAVRL
jgi:hypothetical protein